MPRKGMRTARSPFQQNHELVELGVGAGELDQGSKVTEGVRDDVAGTELQPGHEEGG